MSIIYKSGEDCVKYLKKTLKPYKSVIKEKTTRGKRFAFVDLKKYPKLEECVKNYKSNGFKYNEELEEEIATTYKTIIKKNKYFRDSDDNDSDIQEIEDQLPPKKKKKIQETVLDINLVVNGTEDLDFDLEEYNCDKQGTNGDNRANKQFTKIKDLKSKSDSNPYRKLNGFSNSSKVPNKPEFDGSLGNSLSTDFRIPRKSSQNIETIIDHSNSLARNTRRPVDAYNHLAKYLSEDQWSRPDVSELLIVIAKNMVANNDFGSHVTKFNDLIDRIKGLDYFDSDFWDDIIFSVDKKKDNKNSHQINTFLSGLHNFMMDNKISARLVCNEAVIIAYRLATNHPTAKDLIELQSQSLLY